jgi:hypothetical protein
LTLAFRLLLRGSALGALLLLTASGCQRSPAAETAPDNSGPHAGVLRFTDVAATRGLRYRYTPHGDSPLNILELTTGAGAAFLDYDGDGWLDVLCAGWPRPALFHNESGREFVDVTEQAGLKCAEARWSGCAVGDVDNDGQPDLYLTAYNRTAFFHNIGQGTFRDETAQAGAGLTGWCTSAAFADVNRDGFLDLYVARYVRFEPGMPEVSTTRGVALSLGPEVYDAQRGVLLLNEGGRRFRDGTRQAGLLDATGKGLGVAFAGAREPGIDDLYVANDRQMQDYFENDGHGRFRRVSQLNGTAYDSEGRPQGGMGVDFADYDGDGRLDLFVANFGDEPKSLYRNAGNGVFTHAAAQTGLAQSLRPWVAFGAKFLDADNDGYLDLAVTSGHVQDLIQQVDPGTPYRQRSQFFLGGEGGRFEELSEAVGPDLRRPVVGRALATGDFDNDGRVDLLVSDLDGAPLLLHNEGTASDHWLTLALEGTRSNRSAYGARVELTAGGRRQVREVRADGSFLSAHDPRVHFGLRGAAQADRIEIVWPSGKRQRLEAVTADRIVRIREP